MLETRRTRSGRKRPLGGQAGISLVEILIAATLMLIAAVGMLPIFVRAMHNNISGYDSSQMTSHSRSSHEDLLTTPIDHDKLTLVSPPTVPLAPSAPTTNEMQLGQHYWDEGAGSPSAYQIRLGDGDWITDASAAKGLVFWQRSSLLRQYSYADVSEGVVDASNPNQIVTLGNPKLFDNPLAPGSSPSAVQFKEQSVTLDSRRAGGRLLDVGKLETSYFRTF